MIATAHGRCSPTAPSIPALLLACVILVHAACDRDDAAGLQSVSVTEVDGVRYVHVPSLMPRDVPQWRAEPVFTTADPIAPIELYQVAAARFLPAGALAVANSGTGEIFLLDTSGSVLHTMGGKGGGPGEFVSISGLDIDTSGNIVAYDPRQGRLTRLTRDGQVVATRPLAPPNRVVDLQPLTILDDGRLAAVYGEMRMFALSGEKRDTTPLMFFDADGARADTVGMWPATEWAFMSFEGGASRSRPGFGRTLAYAGRNGRFAIGSNDSLDVSVYDGAGVIAQRILGPAGDPVQPADVDRWREQLLASRSQAPESFRRGLADVPHRETFPGFEHLAVDDAGHTWIGSYVRPGADQRHWLVIASDGHAAGRLTLPASAQVLDVAGDHIAILSRDELDEEYVSVLRIVRD